MSQTPSGKPDPRFIRWGLFYLRRDDPRLLVPKRFGWGWTVNFAHPAAVPTLVAAIVLALGPSALAWWLRPGSIVALGGAAGFSVVALVGLSLYLSSRQGGR